MSVAIGNPIIPQLVEALGLNPRKCRSIGLRVSVDDVVTADVCEYVDEEQLNRVIQCFTSRQYVLVQNWVKVRERLPPDDMEVLLTDGEGVVTAWFEGDDGWQTWQTPHGWKGPKAWMPLPAPPTDDK